jgi:hypothetical protein
MRFHFLLTNHYPYGCYKIEDIVLPIAAGLAELGHRITYGFDDDVPPWPAVNLLVEFFNDPAVVDQVIRLRGAKDRYCFGLIGHEDVAEAAIMDHPNFPDRRPNLERLMPHLDFGWTIVPCDYAMFDGGERMRFLEFGYAETLRRDPPMPSDLDVVFYSDLGPRRVPLYNELVQRGLRVSATFGVLPDFVKFDQLERARVMADVRRADDVRFGAPTRVAAALHRGISIVAERSEPGPLDRLYRYTLTCEIGEFLDRCQQMALAPAGREFGLAAREMFRQETSMRANLRRVMDRQVFAELAAAPPAG